MGRRATGVPEQTVREVLRASADLFVTSGLRGSTTAALASAAGVAESTLLRVAPDGRKVGLYVAAYSRGWEEVWLAVADAAAAAVGKPHYGDPALTLLSDFATVLDLHDDAERRPLVELALRPPDQEPLGSVEHPHRDNAFWRWTSLMRRAFPAIAKDEAESAVAMAVRDLATAFEAWSRADDQSDRPRFPTRAQTLERVASSLGLPRRLVKDAREIV